MAKKSQQTAMPQVLAAESKDDPAKDATADILTFSKKRPIWQQDALRRLAIKSSLSPQDLIELLVAAKIEADAKPADSKLVLFPLAEGNLTSATADQAPIKLKSLGAIENANQLKSGEVLGFGPVGLTLIYGDNGSGKSGYTRIFKAASAARGNEDILPDVFDAAYASKPPAKAVFKVIARQDGKDVELDVPWEDKKTSSELLRQIRVFDRKAAVLYVKDKTDLEFVPFNLDLLDRLGSLCVKLKDMLKGELDELDRERKAQLATVPIGAVQTTAEAVSNATAAQDIETMCKWDEKDAARLSGLQQLFDSTEKTIKALRGQKGRIDALQAKLARIEKDLSDQAISKLINLFNDRVGLKAAAEAARIAAFGKDAELLPGVGGIAWKELWEAARRYSVQEAYSGELFPVTKTEDENAGKCVLCQQDLDADAQSRLESFEKFISGNLATRATAAERAFEDFVTALNVITIAPTSEDELAISEIEASDISVAENLRSFFNEAQERRTAMIEVSKTGDAANIKACPVSCLAKVKVVVDAFAGKVAEAEASMAPARRQELKKELDGLRNRKSLNEHKTALLALVNNRETYKQLDACNAQFDTRSISAEMTELNKKYINEQFKKCLSAELEAIGVRRKVTLQVVTQKGASFVKPKFDGTTFTELERILSEGEHRAVALACFLAETQMAGTNHPIVIDDPVSSLDHERRHLVAKRLVQEASKRQTIIFTHDMVFWCEVVEAAEELKATFTLKDLLRDGKVCGVVGQGTEPWHNLDVNLRLNHIQQLLPTLETLYTANSPEYAEKARSLAVKLRDVWERLIEESLFNKALLRFRKSIETKRLAQVKVELTDYDVIEKGMTRTSNWCHDRSRAQGSAAPIPKELKDEIAEIQTFQSTLKKRHGEIEKNRKEAARSSAPSNT